jgi:hypothetical protein
VQNVLIHLVNHPLTIGIPKPDNWFDYIRQRFLVTAIPSDKWKQHILECARVCASSGWVEIIETDCQLVGGGPACRQFSTWLIEGLKSRGIDLNMTQNLDELMCKAGLINVTKQTVVAPVGPWGGQTGELFAEDLRLGSISIQPLLTNTLHVPKEEAERNTALMVEEFKLYQAYLNIYVYFGQKQ